MASLDYHVNPIYTIKECSSYGALYNKSCGCSKRGFVDKFVRDPNKTLDSSQRPPHNFPKCGNPVDGLYCRQCALLRKKLKKVWFTICDVNENFQDFLNTSKSSNDNTNVVNAPQEPFFFSQDPGENSSQSPPHIDHHCCYGCGDSLDGIFCQRCTCESCGNGAHIGYNCPPKVPIISNPKPCYNQNIDEFPQTLPTWLQQQVVNLDSYTFEPSQCRKIPIYYDDEESSTPLRDISISELPLCIAITPVLSTEDPKDSLIMRDEHLDTISEKELNEFIKSSIENLVPSPSESEDISDDECDLPLCDDFPKIHLVAFSNPLFDIDTDFTASDDESFSEEDVNPIQDEVLESITSIPSGIDYFDAESNLIKSLLNQNTSIDSTSKIDSLLDEFVGELIFFKSIPSGIDEADCDPEEDINLVVKLFDSLIEEIGLSLTPDDSTPPGIENDDYDSEGNILFLEELLINDYPLVPKNESFHFDVP
uniref:Uncharacterized protein n=1 Tax=Tanacetum cinerariifolium TaxID=118510 RepID=A0A6L2M641_TANCI|nr:hypothetical protein [Tanacetum cinerariifolium]